MADTRDLFQFGESLPAARRVPQGTTMLFTIGYEGVSPEAFDRELRAAGIDHVVDVRGFAGSRRKGFAKSALSTRLASIGVRYTHLRGLGDPKPGRDAARAGNHIAFLRIFKAHMAGATAQRDLAELAKLARAGTIALMCYEADPAGCHRSIVAEALATRTKIKTVHLRVPQGQSGARSRASDRLGQGVAAA